MVIGLGVVTGFGTDVNGIGDEGDDILWVVGGLISVVVSFELGLIFVVVSFELGLGGGHTIKAWNLEKYNFIFQFEIYLTNEIYRLPLL